LESDTKFEGRGGFASAKRGSYVPETMALKGSVRVSEGTKKVEELAVAVEVRVGQRWALDR
jgi:hypothetical protein